MVYVYNETKKDDGMWCGAYIARQETIVCRFFSAKRYAMEYGTIEDKESHV
jgi:hypothetical protein